MKRQKILLIVVIVLIGIWYYVANHTKRFSDEKTYVGYYNDVRGLQISSPVYLQGVKVGKVSDIDLNMKDKVFVTFALNETLKIPEGTKAVITTGDMSGSKSVRLELGTGKTMQAGTILQTGFDSTMAENFDAHITPVIHTGKVLLHSTDSALNSFNQLIRQGWGTQTRKAFIGIENKLGNAARASATANQKLAGFGDMVESLDSSTRKPAERNNAFNKSLADAEKSTKNATRNNLKNDLRDLNTSVSKLSANLRNARQNALLTDTQMHQSLTRSLDTLNRSAKDYMKDPPTLINIGFGGKK